MEAGLLRVRDGQGLELVRRTEGGDDLAHRLLARRAVRERLGRERPVQGEFPAADLAVALAQFVFVKWHKSMVVIAAPRAAAACQCNTLGAQLAPANFQRAEIATFLTHGIFVRRR